MLIVMENVYSTAKSRWKVAERQKVLSCQVSERSWRNNREILNRMPSLLKDYRESLCL